MKALSAVVVLLHMSEGALAIGGATSMFGIQPAPTLHLDRNYTIVGRDGRDMVVTPATIFYNYELYDGQNLFTDARTERIPGFGFDHGVLALSEVRNINRETKEPVSLDEVYLHHFTFLPLGMIGAEALSPLTPRPWIEFAPGYAFLMRRDQHFLINAHVLSTVDLKPIDGSLALARKHCNECYYAVGKGVDCTPEVTGTFKCCGDNPACTTGGENCVCQTNAPIDTAHTTKYQIQVDVVLSEDVGQFQKVDMWSLTAPTCSTFESYQANNACRSASADQGSLFHQIQENNAAPETKTKASFLAHAGGVIAAVGLHLHSGGMNATLLVNDEVVCVSGTVYGSNPDAATNAGNEQNHLVHITPCPDIGLGRRFEKGDKFTVESFYYAGVDDERFTGVGAGGEHKNVMSYAVMASAFDGENHHKEGSTTRFNNFDAEMYFRALSPPRAHCAPQNPDTKGWVKGSKLLKAIDSKVYGDRKPHTGYEEPSIFPIQEHKLVQQELRANAPSPRHHLDFFLVACGILLGIVAPHLVAKLSDSRRVSASSSSSSSQVTEATPLRCTGV